MAPVMVAVGGMGARGILFHTSYVAKAMTNLWSLGSNAQPHQSRVHDFYDLQSIDEGPGNAFQIDCDGCLNTGLPGPIKLNTNGLSAEQIRTLNRLTDLAGRYAELLMQSDPSSTLAELQDRNTHSAICFAQAVKSGQLDTSEACGPRNLVGKALITMRDEAMQLASNHLPWLQINFHHSEEIVDITLVDPLQPQLHVRDRDTGQVKTLPPYDLFIKATGTTWKVPVQGPEEQQAYTSIASAAQSREYIERLGLLEDGMIKPGSRLLVGGTSLSALDHVGVILAMTSIVKISRDLTHGFEVNEQEALKFRSLITLFNRTQGDVAPMRYDTATSAVARSKFITPEMLLAIRLQRDQDPVSTYLELARIQTGMLFNKIPEEINKLTSFEATFSRIESDVPKNGEHVASESSTFQILATSMLLSCTTMSGDVPSAASMREHFPLLLRDPLEDFRAMVHVATHSERISWKQNEQFSSAVRTVTNLLAAAPRVVMLLVAQLVRLGVITWEKLSYDGIRYDQDVERYRANGQSFHGLFASRLYTVETDKLWEKLRHQLPSEPPGEAIFKKGRFLYNQSGDVIHVIDVGMSGHGKRVGKNLVHARWHDTNTYAAVQQLMPSIADLVSIFEFALSQKIKRPVNWLYQLEHSSRPCPDRFRQQTECLRQPYNDLVQYITTARTLAAQSSDGPAFAAALDGIKCVDDCRQVNDANGPANCNGKHVSGFGVFQPMDESRFENAFPDFRADRLIRIRDNLHL